jgi:hypothetical protein
MQTMVIISDSTIIETGFRYGLTTVLRHAGIVVLWMVCKGGATAKELTVAWTKAPHADIGLTIYNVNDVMVNWLWDAGLEDDIKQMVKASEDKCSQQSLFFVNDARFYPGLKSNGYPEYVERVRTLLSNDGIMVFAGEKYVGKIELSDKIHFSVESTKLVVEMYSECVITHMSSQARSSRDNTADAPHMDVQEEQAKRNKDNDAKRRRDDKSQELRLHASALKSARDKETNAKRQRTEQAKQAAIENNRLKTASFIHAVGLLWDNKDPWKDHKKLVTEINIQQPPFTTPTPQTFPDGDDRFQRRKKDRVYGCDGCSNLVGFSKWSTNYGNRALGEFQGSYVDSSWADDIPGEILERAHKEGFIDCTWYCTEVCKAAPTGVKNRSDRTQQWRAQQSSKEWKSGRAWSNRRY